MKTYVTLCFKAVWGNVCELGEFNPYLANVDYRVNS
jgi:hypothetical protein